MADARLHVLYVRPALRVYGEVEIYADRERVRKLAIEEAEAVLDEARRRVTGRAARADFEHLDGDPGETIARRAAEIGCDWIVMGTHGRGRLANVVMGSVAQRVVHLSEVPVTLIR
jgi:nucleotide-binding universal stress UspA family protein